MYFPEETQVVLLADSESRCHDQVYYRILHGVSMLRLLVMKDILFAVFGPNHQKCNGQRLIDARIVIVVDDSTEVGFVRLQWKSIGVGDTDT